MIVDVFAPRVRTAIEFVAEVSVERRAAEPNRLPDGWLTDGYLLEPSRLTIADDRILRAADDLADPTVDPYQLAKTFVYYPRWTASHFNFHRELIRIMCVDAGDELKDAWRAVIQSGGNIDRSLFAQVLAEEDAESYRSQCGTEPSPRLS